MLSVFFDLLKELLLFLNEQKYLHRSELLSVRLMTLHDMTHARVNVCAHVASILLLLGDDTAPSIRRTFSFFYGYFSYSEERVQMSCKDDNVTLLVRGTSSLFRKCLHASHESLAIFVQVSPDAQSLWPTVAKYRLACGVRWKRS